MKKILKNIKRFLLACILAFPCVLMACEGNVDKLQGTWISSDSTLSYTFVGDSLYVDMYGSGCGIGAYRLELQKADNNSVSYLAYETIMEDSFEVNSVYKINVKNRERIEKSLITIHKTPVIDNHYTRIIELDGANGHDKVKIEKMP